LALETNLENIRFAWRWALQNENFGLCLEALEYLSMFLMAKARLQEGITFYKQAVELHRKPEPRFLANIQLELAYFFRRLDQYQEASSYAEAALNLSQTLPDLQELSVKILCELVHIRARVGNFGESLGYALRALTLAEQVQNPDLIARSRLGLGMLKNYLGTFEEAQNLYQQVLTYQRQSGQHLAMLRTLSDLGQLLNDMNKPLEARPFFEEGLELAQSQHVPYELAFMWEGLGKSSYLLGDYSKAQQQIELALVTSEMVNDIIGIAIQCTILAEIHLALDQHDSAESYLKRALEITWDKQAIPKVLRILLVWSRLFISKHVFKSAIALLSEVVEHPGAEFIYKQEAAVLLNDSATTPPTLRPSLQELVSDLLNI
jgi:tetratricopeptide (TPR) repeat protein